MTFITVAGLQNIGVDFSYGSKELPVIGCGDTGLQQNCNFVVTNSADDTESLMQGKHDCTMVATRDAFARYIWHDGIECYPVLHDLVRYDFDPTKASLQQLALALACHMNAASVYLVGYHLDNEVETPFLLNMLRLYPKTQFAFIRKPNPQKIGIFKEFPNIVVEETLLFKKMIGNINAR